MTIGETIQRLRTKRRLSQEQLAELVGVSRQAVSKWELNAALPDTDKLVPLARALGVSVDELLGNVPEAGEKKVTPPEPPSEQPGWFAAHWYWLGLIPVAWGGYQLVWLLSRLFFVAIIVLTEENVGVGVGGNMEKSAVILQVAQYILYPLAAIALGLLIFFLGRRHVRRKYGGK